MKDLFGEHRCTNGFCSNDGRYYNISNALWFCGLCDIKVDGPSIRASDLATFLVWASMAATSHSERSREVALREMSALLSKRGVTFE